MRGDPPVDDEVRRFWKFAWRDLSCLPQIGTTDYQPKHGGAFRWFEEGSFSAEKLQSFPAAKRKEHLTPAGQCIYCLRTHDALGNALKLTSEHVIPEYLGSGLEFPAASCNDCQRFTSNFESKIATEMFDPIRTAFSLQGKNGTLEKTNFPLDIGREVSNHQFIPLAYYPTALILPVLFPASSYSRRSINSDDPFNFRIYNINADASRLQKYLVDSYSTQSIDLVRFSQLIAKIAYCYAAHHFGVASLNPTVAKFIRTDYDLSARDTRHFEHVGCLLRTPDSKSENLHEVEAGHISWLGKTQKAVRVRLFASYDMPSYYVTVG